jgi:Flp pilus assembly protein TadD
VSNNFPTLSVAQSMQVAWQHYHAGTREDAMMICVRVLNGQPQNVDALHLLGILAYQGNRQDDAIRLLSEAIRIRKKDAPLHGNLALAKLAKGDLAGATSSARKALALSPSYADAHRVLGLVYQAKGRPQEAVQEFRRAKALGLDSADLERHLAKACEQLEQPAGG